MTQPCWKKFYIENSFYKIMNTQTLIQNIEPQTILSLNLDEVPSGKISRYWLHIIEDGMGAPVFIPILVATSRDGNLNCSIFASYESKE